MPRQPAPVPPPALHDLPLDAIQPDPAQPRRSFDRAALQELAESIRKVGLLHPVPVRPLPGGGYVLVSGERRWRAYQLLAESDPAFARIPAVVLHLTDKTARLAAVIENVVREDLNPIERAEALHALRKALHTTWAGVAQHAGLGERRVRQLAGLTSLRREVRLALQDGTIGEGQARAVRLLGQSPNALRLLDYLRTHPDATGEHALDVARVMKRRPGVPPQAAVELLADGHPAADLPPLPPAPDVTRPGQALAALRGVLRHFDALEGQPVEGALALELLDLATQVGERAAQLRGLWRAERVAE